MVHAERLIASGGEPVLQRGLLEILDTVEPRRHPVAGRRHLARNLGIAAFIGVDQSPVIEIRKPDKRKDEQQNECAAPRQRSNGWAGSGRGSWGHREGRDSTAFAGPASRPKPPPC